jgi:hypothetical protein
MAEQARGAALSERVLTDVDDFGACTLIGNFKTPYHVRVQ